MRDRLNQRGSEAVLVLITFTSVDDLARYVDTNAIDFPALIDRDRVTYRAYGLGTGSFRRVWGWRAARHYAAIVSDESLFETEPIFRQLLHTHYIPVKTLPPTEAPATTTGMVVRPQVVYVVKSQ